MSTQQQITRLEQARNQIRNKLVSLGVALTTDKLDALATKLDTIENRGGVTASVKEGETYTIPKGYHNGTGTVAGVAGGGNYTLQAKTVTPSKSEQNIVSDEGYYGLSGVTVAPIPDAYQDVTSVNATAADVLANKKIVTSDGTIVAGTMSNNGAVHGVLDNVTRNYPIGPGYHNGDGVVEVNVEESIYVTPTKEEQVITGDDDKLLAEVTVAPIPDNFADTTDATVNGGALLAGETAYGWTEDEEGNKIAVKITGTMPNNGFFYGELNADKTYVSIPEGYHDGSGEVVVSTQEKTVTPTKEEQVIAGDDSMLLRKVTVAPIPANFGDADGLTAVESNILSGKTAIIDKDGVAKTVTGTMPNNGSAGAVLNTDINSYDIPAGYHDGTGRVTVLSTNAEATPTKNTQYISGITDEYLHTVTVHPIPDAYQDVTGVTATADKVLTGSKFVDSTGAVVSGTMANNGAFTASIDGLANTSYTIPAGYHDGTGSISLDASIETALADI